MEFEGFVPVDAVSCSDKIIEDMEDFGRDNATEDLSNMRHRAKNSVKIHLRNQNRKGANGKISEYNKENAVPGKKSSKSENSVSCKSAQSGKNGSVCLQNDLVPEKYKIFVKTWGCSHNSSDSEYMAGLLNAYGFQITEMKNEADVWILNSCTVKGPAEQHFKNEIESGQSMGKSLIVSGCVPQSAPNNPYTKGLSIIGVQQIDQVVQVVEETLMGNTVRLLSNKKEVRESEDGFVGRKKKAGGARLHLPKIRRNALIEIIPISTGCLNSCTYCKTKFARGDLGSYSIDEIVGRARFVFEKEGVKEIWLTSEDTGAWGIDLGLNIIDLLQELVKVIPENSMLRIGMTNPPYILNHLEEMAKILAHPRVYAFLHIPVQAGSDAVLSDMKREYCSKDFEKIVSFLREKIPGVTIATDVICGFPTETAEDFKDTLKLVEKYKFPSLFINQFYPRPGTVAAKMPRINTQEVKRRTKELTNLFQSYTPYEKDRIGQQYSILITEVSHDGRFLVGHNKFYEQILVAPPEKIDLENSRLMGSTITVKIVSTSKHSMIGVPTTLTPFFMQAGWLKQTFVFLVAFVMFMISFLYL